MMKTAKYIIALLFVWQGFGAAAAGSDQAFDKAVKLYSSGEYSKAIDIYDSILHSGVESWELYYNLGNAWFKKEEYPKAILFYEKALKINPSNPDIKYNLELANSKIADKIEPLPVFFLKRWWLNFSGLLTEKQWGIATIILWALLMLASYIFFTTSSVGRKKIAFWFGVLMLVFSLTSGAAGYKQYRLASSHKSAIVMTPTVNVKSSPDKGSTTIFVLHQGTKVRLTEKIGNWYRITIANGNKGWIKSEDLRKI